MEIGVGTWATGCGGAAKAVMIGRLASQDSSARMATAADVPHIGRIDNEGIEDRLGTFETRLRTGDDIVGNYQRDARPDGAWRDVVITGRLITENQP